MTALRPPFLKTDIPLAQYLAIEAVNWSLLSEFSRSAKHAKHAIDHPAPPSRIMDLGSLAHAAILEPARFERDYIALEHWLATDGADAHAAFLLVRRARLDKGEVKASGERPDRVTVEGKALWAAFDAANRGRTLVSVEDFAAIRGMIATAQARPFARELLYGEGASEVTGVWIDEVTGIACKIRCDRVALAGGYEWVVDVKTGADASRFERTAASLGYHGQAAMYLDGAAAIAKALGKPAPGRFVHVCLETEPPYDGREPELQDESIAAGRALWRRYLAQYAAAKSSGVWPGYPDGPEPVNVSRWALARGESAGDFE